jgi:Glycosyl hydrolase family 59/F5/8 type C domain/Domain of Unknown Function (DUF1080)
MSHHKTTNDRRQRHSRRLIVETLEQRLYLAAVATTPLDALAALDDAGPSQLIPGSVNEPAFQSVTINGQGGGRIFDGIGGVSASSSRLLFDYPEPQRSELLDYLFKPNYGAGLQILKVEIGSDVNSTAGAEPSHMRTPTDLNFDRGYEWWLMKEARARNPDITLAALEWGAPGWFEGGFWSQDNIDYIVSWLDGAEQHGLTIDYVGGWNESGFDPDWFISLDQALAATHPDVKIIAADDLPHQNWRVATEMVDNPAFRAAVDVLGQHSPGGWRTQYEHYSSTAEAQSLGKPLWTSEQSALSHDVGAGPWARGINRAYIDAGITASLNWAPASAWYANFPLADTGLILAEWPWSGYYQIGSTVWVYAHTTQFARPGWQYITSASGYLESGASYVTLKSPDAFDPNGRDFSIIIETMDATAPSTVQFNISGGLSSEPIHVWSSNIGSHDSADDFIHEQTIAPQGGALTLMLQPGHVYSLSTTTGQTKGDSQPPADVAAQLPLPFGEDFEGYEAGELARYFSDVNGGFEVVPAGGGRTGNAYRQMVVEQPIRWNLAGAGSMRPTTIFGDPRWWGDYELSTDVLLEQNGSVELVGRISAQAGARVAGYHLEVNSNGTWRLYSQDLTALQTNDVTIATGNASFPAGQWHNVALRMQGSQISVVINGDVVGSVADGRHTTGNVGLRVSAWHNAQFDNVAVIRTVDAPEFVPQSQMTVTPSSEHDFFYLGDMYPAAYAIDGRPESFWHSRFGPSLPLPQSLTIDLGSVREVDGLTYQPRLDNNKNGMITGYNVLLSTDGQNFTQVVTSGQWPVSTATKIAAWPAQDARYVRLVAIAGVNNQATAGEVNVTTTNLAQPPALAGDYNQNGVVDAADYVIWRKTQNSSVENYSGADGNGNGVVDAPDYGVWTSNLGMMLDQPSSATLDTPPLGKLGNALAEAAREAPRQASHDSRSARDLALTRPGRQTPMPADALRPASHFGPRPPLIPVFHSNALLLDLIAAAKLGQTQFESSLRLIHQVDDDEATGLIDEAFDDWCNAVLAIY